MKGRIHRECDVIIFMAKFEKKMTRKDELEGYANKYKIKLQKKVPVFVVIDGRSFKTFTKGFERPMDSVFNKAMQETMRFLCDAAQGCVFGYTSSDEITLVLTDYCRWNSAAWFDYDLTNLCSAAASIATDAFARYFIEAVEDFEENSKSEDKDRLVEAYERAIDIGATFTANCFNVPEDRVVEMIYWKQLDHRRHAIQSLGRQYYTRAELLGKCNDEVIEMVGEKGVSWEDMPTVMKHGTCCHKGVNPLAQKKSWVVDNDMPMLDADHCSYLQDIISTVRIEEDED